METSGDTGCGARCPRWFPRRRRSASPRARSARCGAEEQFRRAQHEGVVAAVERIAQDHVHELVDEQRRRVADAAAHQVEIGRFQRPVRAAAGRESRSSLPSSRAHRRRRWPRYRRRHRPARIGEQRRMQRALDHAGVGRRRELGPREIDLEESSVTRSPPPSSRSSRWWPQESQKSFISRSAFAPSASAKIDASPPGSSSPSTSRKVKARSGLRSPRGRKRAERFADRAVLDRAVHGDQSVVRMIAERGGERDFLLRRGARVGRDRARRSAAVKLLRQHDRSPRCDPLRAPRRSAPASTSRAKRRRETRRGTPRAPCLRASPDRASQNMKAPDTAHSPGSAARSNTNVSDGIEPDGAQQFHPRGPRSRDRARTAPRARAASGRRVSLAAAGADAPHQEIAIVVDVASHAFFRRQTRQIAFRHLAEAVLVPGIDRHHQMARKALDQPAGTEIVEAFVLQRGRQRPQARLILGHRHGADRGAEHEPVRRFVLRRHPPASRAARRRPARYRREWHQASRNSIGFSGGACTASASPSAVSPA